MKKCEEDATHSESIDVRIWLVKPPLSGYPQKVELDFEACYQALSARDRRFDGKFFTAVTSTGIYCRTVCPARPPLKKNIRFYACAAAAEAGGFRPCKRCRPDTAPGSPAWAGTSTTVQRALRLISDGALADGDIEILAARLGIGGRHLRRLFHDELGAAPLAIAHVERLHFARKLIEETNLPLAGIAFHAGFQSIRRFNDALKAALGKSPSELRKSRKTVFEGDWLTLRLCYAEPFDWDGILAFLIPRAIAGVETIAPDCYRRNFPAAEGTGQLEVRHLPLKRCIELRLTRVDPAALQSLVKKVRRLFDLDAEPLRIAAHLGADKLLAPLVAARAGLRVPGAFDAFELMVRAVLGQQVTVAGASTLAGRLAAKWGRDGLFPEPGITAEANLGSIGLPAKRAETLRGVARQFAINPNFLAEATDLESAIQKMVVLNGIGPWTAQYVAMRALAEPDAFPASDLGLMKASAIMDPKKLEQRAEAWRPWRAYAAMHLWMGERQQ